MTVPTMSPHISKPRLGQASRATIWDPRPAGPLISASSLAGPAAATCPGEPDREEAEEGEETGEGESEAGSGMSHHLNAVPVTVVENTWRGPKAGTVKIFSTGLPL